MTYEELMALWNERDERYAGQQHTFRRLTDEGRAAAVSWRMAEINQALVSLEEKRRAAARLLDFAKGK